MVLQIKISQESCTKCMQTVNEKSQFLIKHSIASVSLKCGKEAAASNSLPSSSSGFHIKKKTKPTKRAISASESFLHFYQLSKATRSLLCSLEPYGLDCSFTKEK